MVTYVLKSLTTARHHPSSVPESRTHFKLMNAKSISCIEVAEQHTTQISQEDICIFPNTRNSMKWCSDLADSQSSIPCQNSQRPTVCMYIYPSNRISQIIANIKDKLKRFNNKVVRSNGSCLLLRRLRQLVSLRPA